MNRAPLAAASAAVVLAFAAPALADDDAPPPPPPAPAAHIAHTQAGAPALECTTGAHSGTYDGEAETATQIVCDELRAHGARGTFQVTISKLGSATFLSVTDGTGESRRLQLSGIEEVPVAAPRLAEAVLERTSVKSTQKVDNIVGDDQRELKKQSGEMLGGIGLAGSHVFGVSSLALPTLNLRAAYEIPDFAVVADLRYAGTTASSSSQDATFFSIGGGARYFFTRADVTPFVGGGLSFTSMSFNGDWRGDGSGMGAYAEGGIEALRSHKGHLAIDLRVEAPFYGVQLSGYDASHYDWTSPPKKNLYSVPVSFALAYTYRGI